MMRRVRLFCILVFVSCTLSKPAFDADAQDAAKSTGGGTITGTVVYHADSKRRWRYQRYYVKGKQKGPLAETVIALKGAQLKKLAPSVASKLTAMDQKDVRFVPETIVIRAGDRVKFTNSDLQTHNVSSRSSIHRFDVTMGKGGNAVESFNRAGGTYLPVVLGCKYHSGMQAWIYVFDHPWFQITADDGKFRLNNVPPGKYRLQIVHPAGELRWSKSIEVKKGKTTKIEINLSPDDLIDD